MKQLLKPAQLYVAYNLAFFIFNPEFSSLYIFQL